MIELDHVFVAAAPGAPEADALVAAGFQEGPPNEHPGQGTACRRFFFENAYLELLWLEDRAEATSEPVAPTGLADRLGSMPGASRLGICFRGLASEEASPVPTWDYRPPWLPAGLSIPVATPPGATAEPFVFFLPPVPLPDHAAGEHPNGVRRIDEVRLSAPVPMDASAATAWLSGREDVWLRVAEAEEMTLVLGGARQGGEARLGTACPVRLVW